MSHWTPASWQAKPYFQSIQYPNQLHLQSVLERLSGFPGLVDACEIQALECVLEQAMKGEIWLFQVGMCVEHFDLTNDQIVKQIQSIKCLSALLERLIKSPVVVIARMAGVFCKPRSVQTQSLGPASILTYRGDMIHTSEPTVKGREPDPDRMLEAYFHSARTLALIQKTAPDLFVSHEAIHLPFEQAMCRPHHDCYTLQSTHLPWVGMRHLQMSDAHIEFLSGVGNPVSFKVGSAIDLDRLVAILQTVNPEMKTGRVILVHRFAAGEIDTQLPELLNGVTQSGQSVIWVCDPLHGNHQYAQGYKSRSMRDVLDTLRRTVDIHERLGVPLGGVQLEMSAMRDQRLPSDEDFESISISNRGIEHSQYIDPELSVPIAHRLLETWLS